MIKYMARNLYASSHSHNYNSFMGQSSSVDARRFLPPLSRREISLQAQDGLAQDAVVFGCPICTRPCRVISPTQHTCDRCGIAWHAAGCGVETAAPPPLVLLPSDWGPRGWHYDGGRDWTPDTINVGLEMEWHRAPRCPLCKDKLVEQQLPWANRWIYNDLEYEHPWCKRCDINWFRYNAEEFARMQARVL